MNAQTTVGVLTDLRCQKNNSSNPKPILVDIFVGLYRQLTKGILCV